jgi:N-acetylneuraminic acid mutarotase
MEIIELDFQILTVGQFGRKPEERLLHSSLIYQDELIIFGGRKENTRFNDLFAYNFNTETWKEIVTTNRPTARTIKNGLLCNHSFVFFGGYDGDYCQDLWEFNFIERKWKKRETKNQQISRCAHVMGFDGNKLYIQGGESKIETHLNEMSFLSMNLKTTPFKIFQKLKEMNYVDCVFKYGIKIL